MSLARVRHAQEILDQPGHDLGRLRASLQHVAQVNRFLGGDRGILRALRGMDPPPATVLDVGTGSGALPRAIARALPYTRITGVDIHPQTLEIARQQCASYSGITIAAGDARRLPFADASFDVALMSLTLHHFEDEAETGVLRELARVARRAVLVSELERGWPNLIGARLLAATWWRRNPITRHDGPLSVLRAYRRQELLAAAHAAGLRHPRVERHFYFRLLLSAEPAVRAV